MKQARRLSHSRYSNQLAGNLCIKSFASGSGIARSADPFQFSCPASTSVQWGEKKKIGTKHDPRSHGIPITRPALGKPYVENYKPGKNNTVYSAVACMDSLINRSRRFWLSAVFRRRVFVGASVQPWKIRKAGIVGVNARKKCKRENDESRLRSSQSTCRN